MTTKPQTVAQGLAAREARQQALDALYVKRTAAFQRVQDAKEALGKAENELYSIKAEIAELHRQPGQRG